MDRYESRDKEMGSYYIRDKPRSERSPERYSDKNSKYELKNSDSYKENHNVVSDSDSSAVSERHSKRHKSEKKSRDSKKKSKSKHKRKHSHKEHKSKKEKKLYYESGEEVNDQPDEDVSKVIPKKEQKIERESWMTMEGLELDAFRVDSSSKKASSTNLSNNESEVFFSLDQNTLKRQERELEAVQKDKTSAINITSVASLSSEPTVSFDSLNALQARIIKAQLTGNSNLTSLEEEYKTALENHEASQKKSNSSVPSFDARGKYVDIGSSSRHSQKGHKKENKDSDSAFDQDIQSLIQQEKHISSKDQYDQIARNISKDGRYENNEDYQDDRSAQLAAHKHRSEYQKRMIATSDYKKTKRALDNCIFCSKDEAPPLAPIVSMGHHAYLSLPSNSELVPGHCLIVPGEHLLTSLDGEDPAWLEIRNFMKCLMQTFAEQDKGVVFIETVSNLSNCYHTVIECIPLPWGDADDAPGYFKEGLLEADEEWSSHKKVIDTKERTFRKSMTSQLPYFHVWFHPDGGYGHIIEDPSKFPRFFGHEIIAGILNLDPLVWRRPVKYSLNQGKSRVEEFKTLTGWDDFDWTKMLD